MSHQVKTFLDFHLDVLRARADELVANHGVSDWLSAFKVAAFELDPVSGDFDVDSSVCVDQAGWCTGVEQYFRVIHGSWKLPLGRGLDLKDLAVIRQALRSDVPAGGDARVGGGGEPVLFMNDKASILRLLDGKGREGKLGQAQVILRSLDFESKFRIHYEQGLFMKEINLIYGKSNSCGKSLSGGMFRQELLSRVRTATSDSEEGIFVLLDWLARSMGVVFYYLRPAHDFYRLISGDRSVDVSGSRVGGGGDLSGCSDFWPSYGFAPVVTDGSMGSLVERLIPDEDTLRGFGEFMLRSIYSIALLEQGAGGKFMAEFMRWYRMELGGRRITFLSDIHRSVVNEYMDVTTSIGVAVEEYFIDLLVKKADQVSEDRVFSGLKAALQGLLEVDSGILVPGCYSLNRLVWLACMGPSILDWNKCWYHSRLL